MMEQYDINHDGLIVIITGDGITHLDELKMGNHDIFGSKPVIRNIPGSFIFDCCSGVKDRDTDLREESKDSDSESSTETKKQN